MCKTESLCCTAKIKHNILHQLYFNTIKKKSPSGLEPSTRLLSIQSSSRGSRAPEKASCQPCWPLRAGFSLRGQLLAHVSHQRAACLVQMVQTPPLSSKPTKTSRAALEQSPGTSLQKENKPCKSQDAALFSVKGKKKKKKSPDFLPRTQGESGSADSEGRGPSISPGNPGVCNDAPRSRAVSEFLTVLSRGFSSLSPERSQELGLKRTSLAADLENSPINHRSDS